MIVPDTNVWIDYVKSGGRSALLEGLLLSEKVAAHLWVIGELILGDLGRNEKFMSNMMSLPRQADHSVSDVLDFAKQEKIFSQGVGLVDVQLLYSTLISGSELWTFDKNLYRLAKRYGVAFESHFN